MREGLDAKRADAVREMFGRIAHRYDLLNRLLSFGQDVRWRRVLARRVGAGDHGPVLDLCTGTGDVALSCSAAAATVASDFSLPMLIRARRKAAARRRALPLVAADALRLPLRDGAVGTVTVAFGVRNFERLEAGLAEVGRVLRPGGLLLVLEFSRPRGVLAPLLAWWAGSVPPLLGRALSGDGEAYRYLPRSVAEFPSGHDFEAVLARVGYEGVRHRRLTGGVATLYEARTRADGGTPAGSGQEPARPGSGR